MREEWSWQGQRFRCDSSEEQWGQTVRVEARRQLFGRQETSEDVADREAFSAERCRGSEHGRNLEFDRTQTDKALAAKNRVIPTTQGGANRQRSEESRRSPMMPGKVEGQRELQPNWAWWCAAAE